MLVVCVGGACVCLSFDWLSCGKKCTYVSMAPRPPSGGLWGVSRDSSTRFLSLSPFPSLLATLFSSSFVPFPPLPPLESIDRHAASSASAHQKTAYDSVLSNSSTTIPSVTLLLETESRYRRRPSSAMYRMFKAWKPKEMIGNPDRSHQRVSLAPQANAPIRRNWDQEKRRGNLPFRHRMNCFPSPSSNDFNKLFDIATSFFFDEPLRYLDRRRLDGHRQLPHDPLTGWWDVSK